jgi:uncharacterized repeat protein (TIGR03837 family)
MPAAARWDIFCRVIDNYGDAGVCWRLARQLAAEHALDVTLWQDDFAPLARIAPGVDRELALQHAMGVTIRRWANRSPQGRDATIRRLVAALTAMSRAMVERSVAPTCFVLNLSAEAWSTARMPRVSHPRHRSRAVTGFRFTSRTGGLPRARPLVRDRFVNGGDAKGFRGI